MKFWKKREFWWMIIAWFVIIILWFLLVSAPANAWNYPEDGRFKQLLPRNDPWYYIDEVNWDIKAPDKWAHFQGVAWGQQIGQQYFNKYKVACVLLALGVYKEYEDAYREGWSVRDLGCDVAGIIVGMYAYDRVFASFNNREQKWTIYVICKRF